MVPTWGTYVALDFCGSFSTICVGGKNLNAVTAAVPCILGPHDNPQHEAAQHLCDRRRPLCGTVRKTPDVNAHTGIGRRGADHVQHLPPNRLPAQGTPAIFSGQVQEIVGRAGGGKFIWKYLGKGQDESVVPNRKCILTVKSWEVGKSRLLTHSTYSTGLGTGRGSPVGRRCRIYQSRVFFLFFSNVRKSRSFRLRRSITYLMRYLFSLTFFFTFFFLFFWWGGEGGQN